MKKISIIFLACLLMILPGCGAKEKDPTREEIIKISITPMPSPTPAPSELAPEAVVTEGNLTMVNEYLANNIEETVMEEALPEEGATAGAEESVE